MIAFLLAFTATLLGGFVCPWWWPAMVGIALGFWKAGTRFRIFLVSFSGAGLAWGVVALFYQTGNHGLLAGKVAAIFHLPGSGSLVLVTSLVGGIMAGFGVGVGKSLRFFRKT